MALHIREQNAAVVIRKTPDGTTFEIFEVHAPNHSIMSIPGKLARYFPEIAIKIPNSVGEDIEFLSEISSFLAQMNGDPLADAKAKSRKSGSEVIESRETANPHYILHLFPNILRGFGRDFEPHRVAKRIADEVLWDNALLPWRRSPIWLVIRVAVQTSVDSMDYKHFMAFLHAYLLNLSGMVPEFSSDLLAAMRIKMARRLLKVRGSLPDAVVNMAMKASNEIDSVLQARWAEVQNRVPRFGPLRLDTTRGIDQTLPHSRDYLASVLEGRSNLNVYPSFNPNQGGRLNNQGFAVFVDGGLSRSFKKHKHLALFDFEDAVYKYLPPWVTRNQRRASSGPCIKLASCFDQYFTAANSCYIHDMADRSVMMFTIMELWVALDQLVTSRYNILLQYSPEIPDNIIESLLLRTPAQLERAKSIQNYLRNRLKYSSLGSIFSSELHHNSFSIRFFAQSPSLHEDQPESECDARCKRCSLEHKADNMKISIYEWPLPSYTFEAQNVVFELQCPEEFNIWRSMTYKILCDFGDSGNRWSSYSFCTLSDYDSLRPWATCSNNRITLASSTKPFISSHYSTVKIPSVQKSVCVGNGLSFRLYDSAKDTWADEPFLNPNFIKHGTLTLPTQSPYRYLQYALEGTEHSSNEVIANQFDCPKQLSLHEHYAFGTLRSGPRLQWMNIVRGLEENILTFNCEEVHMLHVQAAWQIGVLAQNGQTRDWHVDLDDPEFGRLLVYQAFRTLERVRSNWLEGTTVHTIGVLVLLTDNRHSLTSSSITVTLAARLLASTTAISTYTDAYKFLQDARTVTFSWLEELLLKLQNAESESQILGYQQQVCEMAIICRSTYDVDERHLSQILSRSEEFHPFVSCSVILHDNQPPRFGEAPQRLRTLICRDRRLSVKVLPFLLEKLEHCPTLLNSSVSRYWSGYRPSPTGWTALPESDLRWAMTWTERNSSSGSQQIHFNLLDGKLLVSGKPLGRLPQDYVGHRTYTRLFGRKVLDVVPASTPGMVFSTRAHINNNEVSFYLDTTGELIIQAHCKRKRFELIPYQKFAEDFPIFFSADYHHWMDLDTGVVEFRPLAQPWVSSESNWRLRYSQHSISIMENREMDISTLLVDVHSSLFQEISRRISPLESSQYLHIVQSGSHPPEIEVELPRLKLSFFVNSNQQLESRNFRGQVVDENQSSGTMIGLRDQLVLRAKDQIAKTSQQSRAVLIPYGVVRFKACGYHTEVSIDRGLGPSVTFYHYRIDQDLGCLANSNTSLTSRLFKIYIHAITSYCLPDPLLGRTGTEEALYELSESATMSFDQIDKSQAHLLQLIGRLTPRRTYYPPHLTIMQKIDWNALPALAQHHEFCTFVNSILSRANLLQLFSPVDFDIGGLMVDVDETLLCRAARRTRVYYPAGSYGSAPSPCADSSDGHHGDIWYYSRNRTSNDLATNAQRACWISKLAYIRWDVPTYGAIDLVTNFKLWSSMLGPYSDLNLSYSPGWLEVWPHEHWLTMYNLCRQATTTSNRYALSICLASAVYSGSLYVDLATVLVSFASNQAFLSIDPPAHPKYRLSDGYIPTERRVLEIIGRTARKLEHTPSNALPKKPKETSDQWRERCSNHYKDNISALQRRLAEFWLKSWPRTPAPHPSYSTWFDASASFDQVKAYFKSCSQNSDLKRHLEHVSTTLSSSPATPGLKFLPKPLISPVPVPQGATHKPDLPILSMEILINHRAQPSLMNTPLHPNIAASSGLEKPPDTSNLARLLDQFQEGHAASPLRKKYGEDLDNSRRGLSWSKFSIPRERIPSPQCLEQNRLQHQETLCRNLELIQEWLGPITTLETVAHTCGIWPRLTPRTILVQLGLRSRKHLSKEHLLHFQRYARSYMEYQRSQRLISLLKDEKYDELVNELNELNLDCVEEANDPDWLLVQIDGNFTARMLQIEVAREMISPSSSKNTVLQLNMGEGKSSVIVPIISAVLSDTTRLVRVIVLKPLWRQMFHLLVTRLSGLANRRIYYLPFGRHIRTNKSQANQIRDLYEECIREGGILLAQPEHILSFKLMGIDQLLSPSPQNAGGSSILYGTQKWLSNHTRDILDESDEIMHVRYQLVYTIGNQQSLEGHPDRWTTIQQVLPLVAKHIERLQATYPNTLKFESRDCGQFPLIRILPDSDDIVRELNHSVAWDLMNGLLPNFNFNLLPRMARDTALQFLTARDIDEVEVEVLRDLDLSLWRGLLLARGLLACGILAFALRDKHYRVDYGLDLSRSLLAVPYRAKDTPSLRAEFGHPDVALVLTCLSYYNNGLTDTQLNMCFDLLFKLDNPALEYERWVNRSDKTPVHLRQLSGVNLKDREQFAGELVPTFSRNSVVVDFFLSSVVFPREAKQFSHKLSTSGWDLAEVKTHVTTGFSGTNDNQYLLPASISQSDPIKQSSTNALVITNLLKPENDHYLRIQGTGSELNSAKAFVNLLVEAQPEIRVLLDVGAQMLELTNEELVKYWLDLRPDVAAAVYFNNKDELMIISQNGSATPFHSSPFSQQLDKCIVYLDDGHTRGTDLNLPKDTRAAVTLGPKVTKDRLLQGCMRMRKLGSGHSVMFFAPPEIDYQIREAAKLKPDSSIGALDVIRWTMLETCRDLEHHISYWAQQGVDYTRRLKAEENFSETEDVDVLRRGWVTPESRSLEEMYDVSASSTEGPKSFTQMARNVSGIKNRLECLGIEILEDPSMDEEQEREVSHEAEREYQIERPQRLQPATQFIHSKIKQFVKTGVLSRSDVSSVIPLLRPLETSEGLGYKTWSSNILASTSFFDTLTTTRTTQISDYMRPVNWVLSGPGGTLRVISPYEANELMPDIRRSSHVQLHVYAPRVTQSMLSFADLRFYSVPSTSSFLFASPRLLDQPQLSLFAGQLYFNDYISYRVLCGFLGIFVGDASSSAYEEVRVQSDGFVPEPSRLRLLADVPEYSECEFMVSPIGGLKELIGYRRKGMEYLRTHLGQMLHARQLRNEDF
ncbi:kinase-like protein [Ceratobasidium sp. AG-Ba]|nr:kinase-like protein [Ceratobasidium sp. AG-Ba]